jgi:OFA family oxalate/formate antiporter-like MFS transporter
MHQIKPIDSPPPRFRCLILVATIIGFIFGYSTFSGTVFGLFIKPLAEDFAWSRTEITTAISISTFMVIGLAPLLGTAIDRFGARRILIPSIAIFSALISLTGLTLSSLHELYALFVLITIFGIATVPATYTRVLLNWFDESRGLALAIGLSGVGLAAVIMPPLLQAIITAYGWRIAFFSFGFLGLVINLPLAFFLLKERPGPTAEPNTTNHSSSSSTEQKESVPVGLSAREALRKPALGILGMIFFILGITTYGSYVHLFSMLTDRGISTGQASFYLSMLGVALILSRLLCGVLIDRYHAPLIGCLFILGMALGIGLIASGIEGVMLVIAIGLLGMGVGAELDLGAYLVSRYFGLKAYGLIFCIIYSILFIGATIGPIGMAQLFDRTGSYELGYAVCAAMTTIAAMLFLLMGPYPVLAKNESE